MPENFVGPYPKVVASDSTQSEATFAAPHLLEWLRGKLKDAEKSLECRIQAEDAWRGGTDKSWRKVGCKLTKEERTDVADRQARINVKCRHEVTMFKAVIEILSHSNE